MGVSCTIDVILHERQGPNVLTLGAHAAELTRSQEFVVEADSWAGAL